MFKGRSLTLVVRSYADLPNSLSERIPIYIASHKSYAARHKRGTGQRDFASRSRCFHSRHAQLRKFYLFLWRGHNSHFRCVTA